jgi:hypothetical protein
MREDRLGAIGGTIERQTNEKPNKKPEMNNNLTNRNNTEQVLYALVRIKIAFLGLCVYHIRQHLHSTG